MQLEKPSCETNNSLGETVTFDIYKSSKQPQVFRLDLRDLMNNMELGKGISKWKKNGHRKGNKEKRPPSKSNKKPIKLPTKGQ